MLDDLKGRVAVVTGGGRGLGLSMVRALAAEGVAIGIIDILDDAASAADEISRDFGVAAQAAQADVTDADAVDAAFTQLEKLGRADILITAAGITLWGESTEVTPSDWRRVININLDGTFFACQAFGKRLLAADAPGSAILISSMSGFVVNVPQFQASYNASKAAVSQLAKSLAVEWAPHSIRVNAIAPGYFLSDMTRVFIESNPDLGEKWKNMTPLGRLGTPEDLSALVAYLASDGSSFMTGHTTVIDGGYSAI